jgi:hypothetical protein
LEPVIGEAEFFIQGTFFMSLLQVLDAAHSKQVTSIAWADDAVSLISASLDRTIKVYASAV